MKNCNVEAFQTNTTKNPTPSIQMECCKANCVFVLSQIVSSRQWVRVQTTSKWTSPCSQEDLHIPLPVNSLNADRLVYKHLCSTHTRLCASSAEREKGESSHLRKEEANGQKLSINALSHFQRADFSPPLPAHHPSHTCSPKKTCSLQNLWHRTAQMVTEGGGEEEEEEETMRLSCKKLAFQTHRKSVPW